MINHHLEKRMPGDFVGMGVLLVGIGIGPLFIYEARNLMRQAANRG